MALDVLEWIASTAYCAGSPWVVFSGSTGAKILLVQTPQAGSKCLPTGVRPRRVLEFRRCRPVPVPLAIHDKVSDT